jgi:hypothetical protein
MLKDIIDIFSQYLIPFLALPLLGTIIGSWLSQLYFPFKKKKREWNWEKEVLARETFYENVARVGFLSRNYLISEYEERFSMSAFNLQQTNSEIVNIVRSLNLNAHKISIYLSKSDSKLFRQYLEESQVDFDEASRSWGQWNDDDEEGQYAQIAHTERTIHAQGKIAEKIIENMKKNS